jgi:hypothetical protein
MEKFTTRPQGTERKMGKFKETSSPQPRCGQNTPKGTGRGPSPPAKESSTEAIINDILGTRMIGMPPVCDGDFLETGNLMCN